MGSWWWHATPEPRRTNGEAAAITYDQEVTMLQSTNQDTVVPMTTTVLKFAVHCPGEGPDVTYTHRWMAVREIRRLQEEHGREAILVPTVTRPAFNPWGQ